MDRIQVLHQSLRLQRQGLLGPYLTPDRGLPLYCLQVRLLRWCSPTHNHQSPPPGSTRRTRSRLDGSDSWRTLRPVRQTLLGQSAPSHRELGRCLLGTLRPLGAHVNSMLLLWPSPIRRRRMLRALHAVRGCTSSYRRKVLPPSLLALTAHRRTTRSRALDPPSTRIRMPQHLSPQSPCSAHPSRTSLPNTPEMTSDSHIPQTCPQVLVILSGLGRRAPAGAGARLAAVALSPSLSRPPEQPASNSPQPGQAAAQRVPLHCVRVPHFARPCGCGLDLRRVLLFPEPAGGKGCSPSPTIPPGDMP